MSDQRVEGVSVGGHLPGLELALVTDPADLAPRVALLAQQHGYRLARQACHAHAGQGFGPGVPTLDSLGDAALLVDHHEIGDAGEDPVGELDGSVGVEEHGEEVQFVLCHPCAYRVTLAGDLEADEFRPCLGGHSVEFVPKELEGLVTVRAGVQEEEQQDRSAAPGRQLVGSLAVEDGRGEVRRQWALADAGLVFRRHSQPFAQLSGHGAHRLFAPLTRIADAEDHVAVSVYTD